jgi:hypothetical protein
MHWDAHKKGDTDTVYQHVQPTPCCGHTCWKHICWLRCRLVECGTGKGLTATCF